MAATHPKNVGTETK